MPPGNFAIVVEVPAATQTCFLITPFAEYYDDLCNAIARAANNVNLNPHRTKDRPRLSFIKDIDDMLRAAQVVVAVCVQRPGDECINPNVMYELGKAHALGKPTIIIASEKPTFPLTSVNSHGKPLIPSDLADKHFVKYDAKDRINNLVTELENRMRELLARTNGDLVDAEWAPDIHVVHPRYKMCVLPEFFTNFTNIIAFGERIHHDFQPIDNLISQLERLAGEISRAFPEINEPNIHSFDLLWHDYIANFRKLNRDIFNNYRYTLERRLDAVQEAFKHLQSVAEGSAHVKQSFNNAFELFNYIKDGLKEYSDYHHTLIESQRGSLDNALRDRRSAGEIWRRISDLSRTTKTLVFQSHSVVSHMVDIFIEE